VCVSLNAAVDKIAAVDRLVPGEIHRPVLQSVVPGGKAINVARAATSLGLSARVVPVVGGHSGAWLLEALEAGGLPARPVIVDGESRTCLSVLDRSTGRLTEFYEAGLEIDAEGWARVEAAVAAEVADDAAGTVVVVAGSLPRGVPEDACARLARIVQDAGGRCVVDIGGRPLALAVAARPWMVKVNSAEAAEATGPAVSGDTGDTGEPGESGESAALAAARAMRATGASLVIVTLGIRGSIVLDEAGTAWRIGPAPEHGPYAVGSGDAMLAGLLAGLAAGEGLAQAARRGAAAGTANALRPGQGLLDPGDVARLLPAITLEALP
jgi:1-phosphofructokinase family hexose kinase